MAMQSLPGTEKIQKNLIITSHCGGNLTIDIIAEKTPYQMTLDGKDIKIAETQSLSFNPGEQKNIALDPKKMPEFASIRITNNIDENNSASQVMQFPFSTVIRAAE